MGIWCRKGGLTMFNKISQKVGIESVRWKERHPSFIMNVKKVSVEDSKESHGRIRYYKRILLEDDKEAKFESAIPNALASLITPNRKYRIWYDFFKTIFKNCYDIEILCAEAKED